MADALDPLFQTAVTAIDSGDVTALEALLAAHPALVSERLESPGAWLRDTVGEALTGFFRAPYLLWFVAEDPVRNGVLPANIAQVARTIVDTARQDGVASLQEQLDHAVRLVSWSWIARQCGVQLQLIDVLADAGAALHGNPNNALVNGNVAAARHLIERGAEVTLASAVCLGMWDDAPRLAAAANPGQKQFALVLAALNGDAAALRWLLDAGAQVNMPSADLYSHGTPLHHAVCSGSIEAVTILLDAGGDVTAKDTAWGGTPLGWARHYLEEKTQPEELQRYAAIADLLRQGGSRS